MSLTDQFASVVGRYGPLGCLAIKHALKLVAPEVLITLVVELCEAANRGGEAPRRATTAADQARIGQILGVFEGDLRVLLDAAAPLADMPEAMGRLLASLATSDAQVQRGLAQVAAIGQDLERLEQGQREILDGVGQLGDAQAEQLALQRQGLGEQARLFEELGRLRLDLKDSMAVILAVQAANQDLYAGRFAAAGASLEQLNQAQPALTSAQVLLAAARGGQGDWAGAEAALKAAARARPGDATLARLHARVTRYTKVRIAQPESARLPGPGDRLGPWTIRACLGRGGCGQVFQAEGIWDAALRTVAIKRVHGHLAGDPAFEERFKQEIGHLFRIQGTPGLVNLLSFDKDADFGGWYLVMDYVPGESLQARLERHGALPAATVAKLGAQVAGALVKAHAQGLVHRDIKPANIILSTDGQPVLVDFGIARHDPAGAAAPTQMNSYTALFAAPEQMRKGVASIASDVFALAATLHYALLFDQPAFRDPDDYDPKRVPEPWQAFFDTALASNPMRRYRDMAAVGEVLLALAGEVSARRVVPGKPSAPASARVTEQGAEPVAPAAATTQERTVAGRVVAALGEALLAFAGGGPERPAAPAASTTRGELTVAGRRYLLHPDGTATDTQTGLMWMRCALGQTWDGATCQGKATKMNWHEAMKQTGDGFAGYSDWRLPTIEELRTLVYCSSGKPETWNDTGNKPCEGDYQRPTMASTVFSSTLGLPFWSSSPYANYSNYAWYVNFYDGYVYDHYKDSGNYVRLVRGGQ